MIDPGFEILNQRGTPMFFSDVFANRPTAGVVGRIFISTDTYAFYRDTGTTWDLIGGPGTGTITGSISAGQVAYGTAANTIGGSNNLYFDSATNRLGIGTTSPTETLSVVGTGQFSGNVTIVNNANVLTRLNVQNGTIGALSRAGIFLSSDIGSGSATFGKNSSGGTSYFTTSPTDTYIENSGYGDITIQNAVSGGRIKFAGGGSSTSQMTLFSTGNLGIGVGLTDGGQRLQVTGDTLLKGSGNTSATTALTVQNSASATMMSISNDATNTVLNVTGSTSGTIQVNQTTANRTLSLYTTGTSAEFYTGSAITNYNFLNAAGFPLLRINTAPLPTAGGNILDIPGQAASFSPTSGTAAFTTLLSRPTINQTGGANGITRGLYVNPTLTAAADWRSIEWSNNSGWGLYGAGTSANYLNGDLRVNETGATNSMIFASTTNKTNVIGIRVGGGATQTTSFGFYSNQTIGSAVSTEYVSFNSSTDIASGTYTIPSVTSYFAQSNTKPGTVTITNMYGFNAASTLIQGTNNYGFYGNIAAATGRWNLYMNGSALNYLNAALLIGSTTSTGEALQVTGTMRVSGASTFGGNMTLSLNQNLATRIEIQNTTSGTISDASFSAVSDTSSGNALFGKRSSTTTVYKILAARDTQIYNGTVAGDISILNDFASGSIKMAAGGSSTAQMTLNSSGNLLLGHTSSFTANEKLQVTGTQQNKHAVTYSTGSIQSFRIQKDLTIGSGATISTASTLSNGIFTGDNVFGGSVSVPASSPFANIYAANYYQFSAAGVTVTQDQAAGGSRALSQYYAQNYFKGTNSGTITHMSSMQIAGYYNNNTGSITPVITNAYQLLINDINEYAHTFTLTNRWGIYQEGASDRNYMAGKLMLNTTTDTGQRIQINGDIRIDGQTSGTAGGSSGQHLIINCDGTTYKIALLNN